MDGEQIRRDASLDELLAAGKQALSTGNLQAAHDVWRAAAVANPYDERVWVSLLDVLTHEEDREVCLENIIAINPLNPDARRQLRAIRRERRVVEEEPPRKVRVKRLPNARPANVEPLPQTKPPRKREQRILARAILTGIVIGLLAVVLGVVASVILYSGLLATVGL